MFEIVPNIVTSNKDLVKTIIDGLNSDEFKVLHADIGEDSQRTVLSCVGSKKGVICASSKLSCLCSKYIDIDHYSGNHPCIGALDVLPIVPLNGSSMDDAKNLALEIAGNISKYSPVFLYAENSDKPLSFFRKGGLSMLKKRVKDNQLSFDFGSKIQSSGVSCVGARQLMVAYNIYINSDDIYISKKIASKLRETSKSKYSLKGLKAIGWSLKSKKLTQVSTNLYSLRDTSIFDVYKSCQFLASKLGSEVISSEVIGLIPNNSLTLNNKFTIEDAIDKAQLNKFSEFTRDKILEFAIERSKIAMPDK